MIEAQDQHERKNIAVAMSQFSCLDNSIGLFRLWENCLSRTSLTGWRLLFHSEELIPWGSSHLFGMWLASAYRGLIDFKACMIMELVNQSLGLKILL